WRLALSWSMRSERFGTTDAGRAFNRGIGREDSLSPTPCQQRGPFSECIWFLSEAGSSCDGILARRKLMDLAASPAARKASWRAGGDQGLRSSAGARGDAEPENWGNPFRSLRSRFSQSCRCEFRPAFSAFPPWSAG